MLKYSESNRDIMRVAEAEKHKKFIFSYPEFTSFSYSFFIGFYQSFQIDFLNDS